MRQTEFELRHAPDKPASKEPKDRPGKLRERRDAATKPLAKKAFKRIRAGNLIRAGDLKDQEMFHEKALRRHLGANEAKFAAVLKGVKYGGAFQSMFNENLWGQAVRLLTLLAPALTSTLLALLK